MAKPSLFHGQQLAAAAAGAGAWAPRRRASGRGQWPAGQVTLKTSQHRVIGAKLGAHEGKHDDAVPEPGVEWHETKRVGPWCCDGVAFGILG